MKNLFKIVLICLIYSTFLVVSQLVNPCSMDKNKDLLVCNLDCNVIGTIKSSPGSCVCKPNVVGLRCDRCRAGFYGLGDCKKECNCGPKELGFRCNQTNGECLCKPTVDGKKCLHIQ